MTGKLSIATMGTFGPGISVIPSRQWTPCAMPCTYDRDLRDHRPLCEQGGIETSYNAYGTDGLADSLCIGRAAGGNELFHRIH